MGEPRVHHEGIVGTVEIITGRQRHGPGHPLAAVFRVFGHGQPFAFDEQVISALEAFRNKHLAVFQPATLLVSVLKGGKDLLDCQIAGFTDDQIDGFLVELIEFLMLAQCAHVQLLVQHEIHISSVSNYLCHVPYSPC
jgi:hypothetical protein